MWKKIVIKIAKMVFSRIAECSWVTILTMLEWLIVKAEREKVLGAAKKKIVINRIMNVYIIPRVKNPLLRLAIRKTLGIIIDYTIKQLNKEYSKLWVYYIPKIQRILVNVFKRLGIDLDLEELRRVTIE